MELHRQTCQACGSRRHYNIITRDAGRPMAVFVRCAQCAELVACYEVSRYYHHGKGIESYLRSLGFLGRHAAESGRNVLDEFERTKQDVLDAYPKVLQALKDQGKTLDVDDDGES